MILQYDIAVIECMRQGNSFFANIRVLFIWWHKSTQISFSLCYLLNAKKDICIDSCH